MKKKLLAILLTACMLMTMLPSVAFAVDETGGAITTAEALRAALDAAQSGETITLGADITTDKVVEVKKSITIDGDGHTISTTASRGIWIDASDVTLNLKNLTLDGNKNSERGVQVNPNFTATVNMDNCKVVNFTMYAINLCSKTTVNMSINNSEVSGWSALNLYSDGFEINVTDSTLIGTNDKSVSDWNNFGVVVLEGDTTGQTEDHSENNTVTLTNCVITAVTTNSNRQVPILFNSNSTKNTVQLKGEETKVTAPADTQLVLDNGTENVTSITGGTFSTDPSKYVARGYKVITASDKYQVVQKTAEESPVVIGTVGYETLADAVTAAKSGDTITLNQDIAEGSGIIVSGTDKRTLTIDFNGHTYTVVGNLAGSTGTKSQCFQLLKGSTITMKNGEIVANNASIGMMIQNYCNLTLEDMTLDATKGTNNVQYVMSNNCGTTNIVGNTSITAKTGKYAFDVYYWPNGGYGEGLSVTVNTTGKITGKIEYDSDNSGTAAIDMHDKALLTINNGNFDGEFSVFYCNNNPNISITGGYFTCDPSTYVAKDSGMVATPGTYKGGYNYKVEEYVEVPATLQSVSAEVMNSNGNMVSTDRVVAWVDGNTIKVGGGVSEGNYVVLSIETSTTGDTPYEYSVAYEEDNKSFVVKDAVGNKVTNITIGNTNYDFMVGLMRLSANVAVVQPDSTVTADAGVTGSPHINAVTGALGNGKPTATGLANQVASATLGTNDDGDVTIPTENGKPITVSDAIDTAKAESSAPSNITTATADDLTVVVMPVLNVAVKEIESSGGNDQSSDIKSMTLDITATSKAYVTDKDTAAKVAKGDGTTLTTGTTGNAVAVGSETKVEVNDPLTISFGLPSTFAGDSSTLFADHTHTNTNTNTNKTTSEVVPVTVTQIGIDDAWVGTFTLMGLSDVKIVKDARTANIFFGDSDKAVVYNRSNATETFPTATAPSGKNFAGWSFDGVEGTYTAMNDNLLTTLAGNAVTATAVFSDVPSGGGSSSSGGSSSTYYTITATAGTGGSISPSGSFSVREGLDKTYTITPNTGYIISDVLVDGVSVGAVSTYTFTNLQKGHTISVTFKAETSNHFTDVSENDWFYDEVMNAVAHGWFVGTSDTTFSPNAPTTRGAIVTVLHRMEGKPAATVASVFEDVASGTFYANGVTWAQANGIVNGYDNSKFGPNNNITREQMATILYRYAAFKGYDVTATTSLDTFTDAASVSGFAVDPMKWAVANGLISGKGNGILDPKGSATRAQLAAILTRFDQKFAEE